MEMLKMVVSVAVFSLMGSAMAECPRTLSETEFSDCIVSEGAGQSYESYKREVKELEKDIISQREMQNRQQASKVRAAKDGK